MSCPRFNMGDSLKSTHHDVSISAALAKGFSRYSEPGLVSYIILVYWILNSGSYALVTAKYTSGICLLYMWSEPNVSQLLRSCFLPLVSNSLVYGVTKKLQCDLK